ncbi:MAG: TIGR02266 family protein, partial [Myxococcales bacterium]|nr:TIGR02266 family protein [Myxococcales bacterium]
MPEHRKNPRSAVLLKVRYKSATLDEWAEHYSRDVSRTGIFIKSKCPMVTGTLVKFEFQLRDRSEFVRGVGRVVWRREPAEGSTDAPAGMGIKFIKMDPESRQRIRALVEQRDGGPGRFDLGLDLGEGGDQATLRSTKPPPRGTKHTLAMFSADIEATDTFSSGLPRAERDTPSAPSTASHDPFFARHSAPTPVPPAGYDDETALSPASELLSARFRPDASPSRSDRARTWFDPDCAPDAAPRRLPADPLERDARLEMAAERYDSRSPIRLASTQPPPEPARPASVASAFEYGSPLPEPPSPLVGGATPRSAHARAPEASQPADA